jgi:aspartate carbamoyltransferase catalytic subunit
VYLVFNVAQDFKIGLVGDLLNGRTVHSLAYLLSMYSGIKIYFVAPQVSSKSFVLYTVQSGAVQPLAVRL